VDAAGLLGQVRDLAVFADQVSGEPCGFPVGAGTGGAARSIKAADGSEFLTVAMSDGTYARAEQIYPGKDNSLRLSEESSRPCPRRRT
jgi:hypothetical protein